MGGCEFGKVILDVVIGRRVDRSMFRDVIGERTIRVLPIGTDFLDVVLIAQY